MADAGSKAEQSIQAYLSMWSSNGHFDASSVARFYAPQVVYYGKTFSRAQVLADKEAYIRQWPIRQYTEVPGSLVARCNPGRTICKISVLMRWRRVSASRKVSTGSARLEFDFVPVEGRRKIAREAASILDSRG
ncbi:MAG: hypothetical protein JOY70_01470 [Acidisphaera sp.]|nr:hypothetical protein [Acidisphaera sp.]